MSARTIAIRVLMLSTMPSRLRLRLGLQMRREKSMRGSILGMMKMMMMKMSSSMELVQADERSRHGPAAAIALAQTIFLGSRWAVAGVFVHVCRSADGMSYTAVALTQIRDDVFLVAFPERMQEGLHGYAGRCLA